MLPETEQQILQRVQTDRAQRQRFLAQMRERQQVGCAIAQQAAQQLKQDFGVQRVVLFGSLLNPEMMTAQSDIDLAVWGLLREDLYRAGAAIEQGHDWHIDLVEAEYAKPHIQDAIAHGIEL
jgi:predicted nucleotidyltransferase